MQHAPEPILFFPESYQMNSPSSSGSKKPTSPPRSTNIGSVSNGHPHDRSLTGKSGSKLVSPEYSCRNGEVSDAKVRHIKSSQRQDRAGSNQFSPPPPPPDEPDFSRVRPKTNSDEDSEFARLLNFSSTGKRVTPSPLKRLSGLVSIASTLESVISRVTRFVEILPLWQKLQVYGNF